MFTMRNALFLLAVLAVSGMAFGQPSSGAVVVKPVTAVASEFFSSYTPVKTVDGSGLTFELNTGDDAADVDSVSHHGYVSGQFDGWDTDETTTDAWIQVGLGEAKDDIEGLWVWNGTSGSKGKCPTSVTIQVSSNGTDYADMGVFSLDVVNPTDTAYAQYLQFPDVQGAVQFIKLTIKEVGGTGTGSFVGIREIRVSQVPEPMTMSLLALGGLGLLRRRRA